MLKRILKVIGALIGAFIVIGAFLPSTYVVQRSVDIKAPPDLIFEHVANLKLSESWSPWAEQDPTMKVTYSGPESGVGAKSSWTSEKSGSGSQQITRVDGQRMIEIGLDFGAQGRGTAEYDFVAGPESVKVTWSMEGDVGFNLIGRYFGLMMDGMLGSAFETGLAKLKRVTEAKAKAAPPAPEAPKEEAEPFAKLTLRVGGFETPESILYDAQRDVYLVSNINGSPFGADDNGYISKVGADGSLIELKWIDGATDAVKLNAPKGMTLVAGVLYVSDINTVRMFDIETGAPKGEIVIRGAQFLNDLTSGPDGVVYVSDSGLKEGFKPGGADAVYKLVDGKAVALIKDKTLGGPNGLLATEAGVWVVTFGSGELYLVTPAGDKTQAQALPTGGLDGIVQLNDGALAVSSWGGSQVLKGRPGATFEPLVPGANAPADIGYDSKRDRILIPHFQDNVIQSYPLSPPQ